ncbi:MAG TPA: imidazole glycerol phosphate synthase subunit HisH [Phycisphaerae bacterium]|nr:imidazole glycerol phosphate synthase subunit HisH [Phycisphaerae bacterium]
MLTIVDYGMGNLRSVQKAFELLGFSAQIVRTPEDVRRADKLILPGVGAFGDAVAILEHNGLDQAIHEFIGSGKPFLGICLGMQLLMAKGFEDGEHDGLGVIQGDCVRFTVDQPPANLKVPHMGWNAVDFQESTRLFSGLKPGAHFYFVHSYYVRPNDAQWIAARADYGGKFVAALSKDNVMATQFHPEKSQLVGRVILRNFAEWRI